MTDARVTQQSVLTLSSVIPKIRVAQQASLTLGKITPPMRVTQLASLTLVRRVIQPAILPEPESGVNEVWEWKTDTLVSQDGTEQRIALRDYPRRSFSGEIIFDDEELLNRQVQFMMDRFGDTFVVPLFHYRMRPSVAAAEGDQFVSFDTSKMDISQGDYLYLFSAYTGFQLVTVVNLFADRAEISLPVLKDYGDVLWIMPCAVCIAPNNVNFTRATVDYYGSLEMRATEVRLHKPFIRGGNIQTLEIFDGLPVLNVRPTGTEFETSHDMGLQVTDYETGVVSLRNPWRAGQNVFQRNFMLHRARKPADFDRWKVFADYCKGSQKPFLMPSFRKDFEIVTPAAPGSDRVVVDGIRYGPTFFKRDGFRRVTIQTRAGLHRAIVWSAARDGDTNVLYFQPPLPVGAAWGQDQKVSFLMQVRIADDRISFEHESLHSTVSVNMRTVDDDTVGKGM